MRRSVGRDWIEERSFATTPPHVQRPVYDGSKYATWLRFFKLVQQFTGLAVHHTTYRFFGGYKIDGRCQRRVSRVCVKVSRGEYFNRVISPSVKQRQHAGNATSDVSAITHADETLTTVWGSPGRLFCSKLWVNDLWIKFIRVAGSRSKNLNSVDPSVTARVHHIMGFRVKSEHSITIFCIQALNIVKAEGLHSHGEIEGVSSVLVNGCRNLLTGDKAVDHNQIWGTAF